MYYKGNSHINKSPNVRVQPPSKNKRIEYVIDALLFVRISDVHMIGMVPE